MNKLFLKEPKLEELGYRQHLLADVETMSYNKGHDIPIKIIIRRMDALIFQKMNGSLGLSTG